MIRNIFKDVLRKKSIIKGRYTILNTFSTKVAPQKERLQDWEYVQMISKQIKNNDINQALKFLIQSHLHNQILNKQIYYSLQQKMSQISALSGYHQILYKLYRQNFQPNMMTLNWMNIISKTQNPKLASLLKEDYLKLNQTIPAEQKSSTIQISQEKEENEEKIHIAGRKSRKVPTIPTTDEYYSKTPEAILVTKKENVQKINISKFQHFQKNTKSTTQQSHPSTQQIQIETKNQIQQVLENMFKEYGKITLHNLELILDNNMNQNYDMDEQVNQIYDQHQNHQQIQEELTMNDYVLQMLASISKIKIGKIELQSPQFLTAIQKQIKTKNDTHKPDN